MALFDFTSLFASENAARIVERKGKKILLCVVGDSLVEVGVVSRCGLYGGYWVLVQKCRVQNHYMADMRLSEVPLEYGCGRKYEYKPLE